MDKIKSILKLEKVEDYISFAFRCVVIILSTIGMTIGAIFGVEAPMPLLGLLLKVFAGVSGVIGLSPEGLVWITHGILSFMIAVGKGFNKPWTYVGASVALLLEGITFYWGALIIGPILLILNVLLMVFALWLDHNDWSIKK